MENILWDDVVFKLRKTRQKLALSLSGVRGSVPVLTLGRKLDWQPVLSCAPNDPHVAVKLQHTLPFTSFCAFNTCVGWITFFLGLEASHSLKDPPLGLAASHSSKDPPSLAYWLFASPQLNSVRWCCGDRAKLEKERRQERPEIRYMAVDHIRSRQGECMPRVLGS